jgi:hypothetical protein
MRHFRYLKELRFLQKTPNLENSFLDLHMPKQLNNNKYFMGRSNFPSYPQKCTLIPDLNQLHIILFASLSMSLTISQELWLNVFSVCTQIVFWNLLNMSLRCQLLWQLPSQLSLVQWQILLTCTWMYLFPKMRSNWNTTECCFVHFCIIHEPANTFPIFLLHFNIRLWF